MKIFIALFLLFVSTLTASAQSAPDFPYPPSYPSRGQWISYFAAKQDLLGFTPLNTAGGSLTGELFTLPSNTTGGEGLNIGIGGTPPSPSPGALWATSSGLFFQPPSGSPINITSISTLLSFPSTVSGTALSGGIPYFNSSSQMSSSAVLAANALVIGGGAGVAPSTVTTSASALAAIAIAANASGGFALVNGSITVNDCLKWATAGITDAGGGCSGTFSFPITVAGTVTSGGVPYFSSTTVMSTSAALAASAVVLGGGAGSPPVTTTTGTGVVTAIANAVNATGGFALINGALTINDCLKWSAGGIVDASVTCGSGGSVVLTVGTTATSGGAAGQLMFDSGSALNESSGLVWSSATPALEVVSNTGAFTLGTAQDVVLTRDGVGQLAQRNGTSSQLLSVYNTFTSATNYERGGIDWQKTANILSIGTEKGSGGGSTRNIEFLVGGINKADYGVSTPGMWTFADNTQFNNTLEVGGQLVVTGNIGGAAGAFTGNVTVASLGTLLSSGLISGGSFLATGTAATATGGSQVGYGGITTAASLCGSLAGSHGCVAINVGGVQRNIPYY